MVEMELLGIVLIIAGVVIFIGIIAGVIQYWR